MSLDELLDESKEDEENTSEEEETKNETTSEDSGLSSMIDVKSSYDKLQETSLCSSCGSSNTENKGFYWRCQNDNCDTITYINSESTIDRTDL